MWQFLRGYVILQIEGFSAARLMKRMTEHGIRIRHAVRTGPTSVRMEIDAKRFFALKRLRKGLPVRIRILERCGLPFLGKRLAARPVLWIGTLLLFAGILLASGRIWLIRVEGTARIDPEEVKARLRDKGITVGARLQGPILITAANELSAEIADAAWIGLDREGVTLTANVVEAMKETPKIRTDTVSDVVADQDGVLTKLVVTHGQARAAVGDAVKAGDVLICGTVIRNDSSYETWADGEAAAAVTYTASAEAPETVTEWTESGATETLRAIRLFDWTLITQKPSFERYRVLEARTVSVSDRLPIVLAVVTVGELVERERVLSAEEAEQLALVRAMDLATEQAPKTAAILHRYATLKRKNGKTIAEATIITEETIGRTEERPHGGKPGESG